MECHHYKLLLPFTFCRRLVSERTVEIVKGTAKLYCCLWRNLMLDVFDSLLELEIERLKPLARILVSGEDDRIRRLLSTCAARLGGSSGVSYSSLLPQQVDHVSRFFPPCMANLHKILRQTHRLSFDSRYLHLILVALLLLTFSTT